MICTTVKRLFPAFISFSSYYSFLLILQTNKYHIMIQIIIMNSLNKFLFDCLSIFYCFPSEILKKLQSAFIFISKFKPTINYKTFYPQTLLSPFVIYTIHIKWLA